MGLLTKEAKINMSLYKNTDSKVRTCTCIYKRSCAYFASQQFGQVILKKRCELQSAICIDIVPL